MLTFTTALTAAGIDPARVRLLRHHKVYPGGCTPHSLWRDHHELFNQYQSTQDPMPVSEYNRPVGRTLA